jgi:16S rRNA processing protein RimM
MQPRRDAANTDAGSDEVAATDGADDVIVGHVQGAWGVRGEVKVAPQSADAAALLHARRWRLEIERDGQPPVSSVCEVRARRHAAAVVARIVGVDDRDAAQALAGARIRIPRDAFPKAGDGEYYWVDLIGCHVVNRLGEPLGEVLGLIDTGVHSVLRVGASGTPQQERLVPFVDAYVDGVDLTSRVIRVDWGRDY